MLGSQAYVQGIERRPARALSGALKDRAKDDGRGMSYGYAGDPGKIRWIPCCMGIAYTLCLSTQEHIPPPSLLWCPVSSEPGPGVNAAAGAYMTPLWTAQPDHHPPGT